MGQSSLSILLLQQPVSPTLRAFITTIYLIPVMRVTSSVVRIYTYNLIRRPPIYPMAGRIHLKMNSRGRLGKIDWVFYDSRRRREGALCCPESAGWVEGGGDSRRTGGEPQNHNDRLEPETLYRPLLLPLSSILPPFLLEARIFCWRTTRGFKGLEDNRTCS